MFLVIAIIALASLASAQKKQSKIERIEVTGSHIKRIDIEGPSPVLIIDREDIDESGYNSIADVLRDITENSFGSSRGQTTAASSHLASINLRGLGESRNLVLLDGRRLPTDPISAAVDLHLIPIAAVERVEILKDGASATYGTDALGGVVNIVTKKDIDQFTFDVQRFQPLKKGGAQTLLSAVGGLTRSKGSLVAVFNLAQNESLMSKDRGHSATGYSAEFGDPGIYRTVSGNTKGPYRVTPDCPQSLQYKVGNDTKCLYNTRQSSSLLPSLNQMSGLVSVNYDFSSNISGFALLTMTQKKTEGRLAPTFGTFTVDPGVASTLDGGNPLPGASATDSIEFNYRFSDLGARVERALTSTNSVTLGLKGLLTGTWDWEATFGATLLSKRIDYPEGYALKSVIEGMVNQTNTNLPRFNFYPPAAQRDSVAFASYQPRQTMNSNISQLELKAAGELFEWPSGVVSTAVGLVTTKESFTAAVDNQMASDNVLGVSGYSGIGDRSTISAYSEMLLPLRENFEVQLSGRYDGFSDFGSTFNPKVAMKWTPTSNHMVRASVGTGFKAPRMQDLYATSSRSFISFIDHKKCDIDLNNGISDPAACSPQKYEVINNGNEGLSEERSQYWNIGAIWEPHNRFNVGFDLWQIHLSNLVDIDFEEVTFAEKQGIDPITQSVLVNRDSENNILNVTAPLQNLSAQDVGGLDISSGFRFHSPFGRFFLRERLGVLLWFRNEGFEGAGFRDKLGENGKPVWRNILSARFFPSQWTSYSLVLHTTGSHEKVTPSKGRIPMYSTIDFQYTLKLTLDGEVTAGVKNILDAVPPLDDSNPFESAVNKELYDEVGRIIYLGYSQSI